MDASEWCLEGTRAEMRQVNATEEVNGVEMRQVNATEEETGVEMRLELK